MIRTLLARWKWRKAMNALRRQIEDARKHHRATRHIEQARRDFVHACLRGNG